MAELGAVVGLIKALGRPDPAVIKESVEDWLDDHPEATTTVEDGSITKAKLDEDLQDTVDDVSDLKSAIDDKLDTSRMEKLELVEIEPSANLLNPDESTIGVIINISTGATSENASYWTSGFMPVEAGKTYYLIRRDLNDSQGAKRVAAFDKDKQVVSASGTSDVQYYTVPNGVAYIRISKSFATSWAYYLPKDFMVINNASPTEFVDFEYAKEYYLADDEFMKNYLDFSMVNRMDPDECALGKIVNVPNGELSDNASYFTTNYIRIYEGETLYFYRRDTKALKGAERYAAYDIDKNVIPNLGSNDGTNNVQQKGRMAYIRVSFALNTDYPRMPIGTGCIPETNPDYVPGYGGNPVIQSKYSRRIIRVRSTDTEKQIIEKFVQAFNVGGCDVVFDRARYTFGQELEKVRSDYGVEYNEIPIGNGCRYFFNGSTLTATVDLSQHPSTGDDEFYCNFFGCQRRPSSYEMYDGVLHATDTRYVVHDESSAMTGSYRHLYQNMEMHYHTDARQESIRKCIGGGTGESGVVEIVGCKFTTDGTANCVAFHGNGTDVEGAEFDLNVRGCWFSNSLRVNQMSTNQTARLFYTGNSADADPTIGENCTVTSFMNEVRT